MPLSESAESGNGSVPETSHPLGAQDARVAPEQGSRGDSRWGTGQGGKPLQAGTCMWRA